MQAMKHSAVLTIRQVVPTSFRPGAAHLRGRLRHTRGHAPACHLRGGWLGLDHRAALEAGPVRPLHPVAACPAGAALDLVRQTLVNFLGPALAAVPLVALWAAVRETTARYALWA